MNFPYSTALEVRQQYKRGKITREEAKEQLAFILDLDDSNDGIAEAQTWREKASYGPLLRLSDVCNILRMWAALASVSDESMAVEQREARREFAANWQSVDIAISKSNALARFFFTNEGVRTEKCIEHKGIWSGCQWSKPCECQSGSNVTGWLALDPKFSDATYWKEEEGHYMNDTEIKEVQSGV